MFSAWYFVLNMINPQSVTVEMNRTEKVGNNTGSSYTEDRDKGPPQMGQ